MATRQAGDETLSPRAAHPEFKALYRRSLRTLLGAGR